MTIPLHRVMYHICMAEMNKADAEHRPYCLLLYWNGRWGCGE